MSDVIVEVTPRPTLQQVVAVMRRAAVQGSTTTQVIQLVQGICRELDSGDYASEILACYYWVCQNIRYIRDPDDAELVKDPQRVLQSGTGDCDDQAVLLASMLMAAGNKCSFVLAAFRGLPVPSHVFVEVQTPRGPVPLDPVANALTGRMLGTMTSSWRVPINGDGATGGAW